MVPGNEACATATWRYGGPYMLKVVLWIVGIIFVIGLLTVSGVFALIF